MHGQQPPSVRLRESNSGKIAHARRMSSLCMHALYVQKKAYLHAAYRDAQHFYHLWPLDILGTGEDRISLLARPWHLSTG